MGIKNMYNKNSGYGLSQLVNLDQNMGGKVIVVGDNNAVADRKDMIQQLMDVDPDGQLRFYTSLQAAIDGATANALDTVYLLPGYSETVTAQIDADKAGVRIVGLGFGSLKPTITGNGAIDAIDVSAANVKIENIHFAAPETDAQTSFINVDAAGCTLKDISGVGSQTAKNVVDCITVTANADDLTIDGLEIVNRTVAVNSFISLEGAASTVRLYNIFCFGDVATAGLIDAAKVDYLFMENVNIGVVGTTKPAATLDSNPEGYARNCNFAGTHGTLATNANLGNLMRLFDIKVEENTDGSSQGALIPAVVTD